MKYILLMLMVCFSCLFSAVRTKKMIDIPTAAQLQKAELEVSSRFYKQGGILMCIQAGISNSFQFGISYGSSDVIGNRKIDYNELPGVMVQYCPFLEGYYMPSIAIGFNSQGYGRWRGNRYDVKSKGVYLAFSKNFFVSGNLGTLGIHGGINYAVTEKKDDDDVNFFLGLDKSIGPHFDLVCEYDFALNDDENYEYHDEERENEDYGYLNLGLKFYMNKNFKIEFFLKDILKHSSEAERPARAIKVSFNQMLN